MTKDEAVHEVVALAYDQVGYREGANNWNKYADDPLVTQAIGWNVQNQPWCATFVVWLFVTSFGYYQGKEMMYGCSPGCAQQASYYQSNHAFFDRPEKGDQIFFYSGGGINHTGIVVDISGSTITTVEGNYSDSVSRNTYFVGDTQIAGYGRPNWDIVAKDDPPEPEPFVREYYELQYGDGLNNPSPVVKAWQALLLAWGFNLGRGGADGEFGSMTLAATQKFQRKLGLDESGNVGEEEWKQSVYMPV